MLRVHCVSGFLCWDQLAYALVQISTMCRFQARLAECVLLSFVRRLRHEPCRCSHGGGGGGWLFPAHVLKFQIRNFNKK